MPEPLRQAVHQLVSEVVMNCQEVLRYTEPDLARDWKRMTLIRATDASDTMDTAAMLIAAYCQHTGMALDTLASYLQTRQQRSRAAGPRDAERHEVAGMLGTPRPADDDQDAQMWFSVGQGYAGDGLMSEPDEQRLFTEACLHGLRAKLCNDLGSLDRLPPEMAAMARRVAECLEVPEPATA
ncbi:hypothetical protein MHW47_11985 [Streptomyces sp. OfavH-34-F]|uniref:hypothetical protein n=1 Tax=Streptomyces sp. OfavH-34-F TaxID=2917760 RepID=UPI001EF39FE0|nr:hypothetical protein [Streptomyces sp. OfavH-34-F]MCG7525155.1 hypothetical protein [Streptomyces sp. OfavH-34-F]